ncbi:Unknown protein [Striga hermonthica]|uniref:Uncharacterized protein n=1 Tax=Striga hermonthica TaxID=68872 RepID=A0A9N7RRV2_STRHE|nr:Unknown protein [Striga hermonthica]
MARLSSFPLFHFPILLPASPAARSLPFSPALHFSSRKIHGEHTRARAIREWQEYEEAVNRKDLARALRILTDVSLELEIASTEPARAASGELGFMGLQRDWEVLDTCLNADDLRLVGSAYAFLKDRGLLPNFGKYSSIGTQFWDEKLENELAEGRVNGTAFDRYCMVLFAGIAAEALVYGEAEGGENDENLFRSISVLLEPPLSVAQMSNQARWSVLQSHNLLKWHKHAHRAAVKALEKGDSLSVVIKRIEEAMSSVV